MNLVEYNVEDRICFITLNRPEKRNALNPELVAALKEALDRAQKDTQAKVIVLQARGEAFCAGADLAYLQQLRDFSYEENLADSTSLKELFEKIYTHDKVVIAQVQGHALAGGCGLVTVCDFCFTVDAAKFGYTEVKIGFVPAIVMAFLVRKIGEGKARHLLLGGSQLSAKEAYSIGLVNCVSQEKLLESDVLKFAEYLVRSNSGEAMRLTKKMLTSASTLPLHEMLQQAAQLNARARATEDCKKGIDAFLNKQKITW